MDTLFVVFSTLGVLGAGAAFAAGYMTGYQASTEERQRAEAKAKGEADKHRTFPRPDQVEHTYATRYRRA